MNAFFEAVYAIVAAIPRGKVVSYGQIARMLRHPRGARQVGRAMRLCPDGLPWQRVVMADGRVAGGQYAPLRRAMLEAEGVPFLPDGRVDMDRCRWQPEPPASASPQNKQQGDSMAQATYTARVPSPLGDITLMSDGRQLTGLWLEGQARHGDGLPDSALQEDLPVFQHAKAWLARYFKGDNPGPKPALAPKGTPFQQQVWQAIQTIPQGEVRSYSDLSAQVAAATGSPCSPRAVGAAAGRNPISLLIPCHRVVGKSGQLTGYAGGLSRKKWLLRLEGVKLKALEE